MADRKNFLDIEGLKEYDTLLKELLKNQDEQTLQSAKDYIDNKIGDYKVTLGATYETVAKAILGERIRAERAEAQIASWQQLGKKEE